MIPGRLALLPVTRRRAVVAHAIVDAVDYDRLSRYRWRLDKDGYAVRGVRDGASTRNIGMHRDVLGLTVGDGQIADHINRDTLDNRRENLRAVTKEQSAQNRGARRSSRSRSRGVNFVQATGRWIARVRVGDKLHNLGTYDTVEEASRVAAAFRERHMPYSTEEVTAP